MSCSQWEGRFVVYNAMNIAQRPYMPNGQGYKSEEESNEQTQDSLQGNSQRGNQAQDEPRTIARGRAPQQPVSEPPMAFRPDRKPVAMGNRPRQLPPKPVRNNHTVPQQQASMPQQMGTPMTRPMGPMPQGYQPVQQPIQQPVQQQRPIPPAPHNYPPVQQNVAPQGYQPVQQPIQQPVQQQAQSAQANQQAQVEKMARNNRVNIAQVIKDFRGTYAAIGTPNCLVEEIEDYLNKVIEHTKGDAPSINFVQTNLQNGAVILDKYISDTLEKESKVVQNWLEALFLQRINYSYNEEEINEDFLVKFPKEEQTPEEKQAVQEAIEEPVVQQEVAQEIPDYEPIQVVDEPVTQVVQEPIVQEPVRHTVPIQKAKNPQLNLQKKIVAEQPVKPIVQQPVQLPKPKLTILPEDTEVKALFLQAKKHAYSNNPAKAMNILEKALIKAEAVRDEDAQSQICYEMAKIYDDNNYLAQALSNYNRSLQVTTDVSMKTKAHYSMAKIYDDVNQFDSAINHYFNSVSYAGKEDNLSSQSKSLTNIGNIYTDKYDPDAFIYYDEANVLVTQTEDAEMKGYVSSNTAGAFNKFNLPEKALKCYASAVQNYSDANQNSNVAENYKSAGELMFDLKYPNKAKVLLRKALAHTDKYRDKELINQINDLLEEIG